MGGKSSYDSDKPKTSIAPSSNARGFSNDKITAMKNAEDLEQIKKVSPEIGEMLEKGNLKAGQTAKNRELSPKGEEKLIEMAKDVRAGLDKAAEAYNAPGGQKEGQKIVNATLNKSGNAAKKIIKGAVLRQESGSGDDGTGTPPDGSEGPEKPDTEQPEGEGSPPSIEKPPAPPTKSPTETSAEAAEAINQGVNATKPAADKAMTEAADNQQRSTVADYLFSVWGKMIDVGLGIGGIAAPKLSKALSDFKKEVADEAAGKPKYQGPQFRVEEAKNKRKEAYRLEAMDVLKKLDPSLENDRYLNDLAYIALMDRMEHEDAASNASNETEIEDMGKHTPELIALRTLLKTGRSIFIPDIDLNKSPEERIREIYQKIGITDDIADKHNLSALEKAQNEANTALENARKRNASEDEIKGLKSAADIASEAFSRAAAEAETELNRIVFGVEKQYETLVNEGDLESPEITNKQGEVLKEQETLIPRGDNQPETLALARAAAEEGYHVLVQDYLTGLTALKENLAGYDKDEREAILNAARKDMRKNKTNAMTALNKAKENFDKDKTEKKAKEEEAKRVAEKDRAEKEKQEAEAKSAAEAAQKQEKINNAKNKLEAQKQNIAAMGSANGGSIKKATEKQEQALAEMKQSLEEMKALGADVSTNEVGEIVRLQENIDFVKNVILPPVGNQGWSPSVGINEGQRAEVVAMRQTFMDALAGVHAKMTAFIEANVSPDKVGQGLEVIKQGIKTRVIDSMAKNGAMSLLSQTDQKDAKFLNSAIGAMCMNLFIATIKKDPNMRRPKSAATKEELDASQARFDTDIQTKATELLQSLGIPQAEIKQIIKANSPMIVKEL